MKRDIEQMYPQNGRILKEDSLTINRADYAVAQRQASIEQASRDGTLSRGWFQGQVAGNSTAYFVLLPPPGLVVYGETREITLLAGEIQATYLVGGTLGAPVGSPLPAFNFDAVAGPAPQSVLQQYATVTGAVANSPEATITAPTTGPRTIPSSQTTAGAHVRISNEQFAAFEIVNPTGDPEDVTLFLTWQELP